MSFSLLATGLRNREVTRETVSGIVASGEVAASLVRRSVEFHVEPMPDDRWHFTVKREAQIELDAAVARAEAINA